MVESYLRLTEKLPNSPWSEDKGDHVAKHPNNDVLVSNATTLNEETGHLSVSLRYNPTYLLTYQI